MKNGKGGDGRNLRKRKSGSRSFPGRDAIPYVINALPEYRRTASAPRVGTSLANQAGQSRRTEHRCAQHSGRLTPEPTEALRNELGIRYERALRIVHFKHFDLQRDFECRQSFTGLKNRRRALRSGQIQGTQAGSVQTCLPSP